MAAHRERVLTFLEQFPGRDDDEIASALNIAPRQTVNIVCRKLSQEGRIRRELGPRGKLINSVITGAISAVPAKEPNIEPRIVVITEDQVKQTIATMLEQSGWSVKVAWGRTRGVDITATRGDERWLIECKGTGSRPEMHNNYFVAVVGEVLQRMHDDRAKHSIAFPELPKYRRLWSELPTNVKQRLQLSVLFVGADHTICELTV